MRMSIYRRGHEMRMLYKSRRIGWGDEYVVQQQEEKVGRKDSGKSVGGEGWEMRMLWKTGR